MSKVFVSHENDVSQIYNSIFVFTENQSKDVEIDRLKNRNQELTKAKSDQRRGTFHNMQESFRLTWINI